MHRVTIVDSRGPFEVALLAVTVAAGALGLTFRTPGPSTAITNVFGAFAPLFYAALLASSVMSLAGVFWPRRTVQQLIVGLHVERIGLPLVAGTSGAFAMAAVISTGVPALISASLVSGIAAACCVRTWQIGKDLRELGALTASAMRDERDR